MPRDIAGISAAGQSFLKTWNTDGRSQCLHQLASLVGQRDRSEELRVIFQTLVNALVTSNSTQLLPDDLANLYIELMRVVLASSESSDQYSIHQVLLDCVSAADDALEESAIARAVLAKGNESKPPAQDGKDKKGKQQAPSIPERKPLVQLIRRLLTSNVLSQDQCAISLEYALLQEVGMLRDAETIQKLEVRVRTRLIYKQTKVNLLREQSEGYSKFTIELSTSMGPPQEPMQGMDMESQANLADLSQQATNRLMNIAGYFDLDPTRMLDLILDVFSSNVMTHYGFFIQLLRHFTKSRTLMLSAGSQEVMQIDGSQDNLDSGFEQALDALEHKGTSVPSSPNLTNPLAQLLGFKFRHYDAAAQNVPQALMFVAALLIRERLVSIRDFYDHLSPDEEGMSTLRQKYEDEMKKRTRTAKTTAADKDNALANAPVLSTIDREYANRRQPPPTQAATATTAAKPIKEPKLSDELNQARDLAIALLSIGAMKPGLFILSKHPWLVSRYPQLADILLEHLDRSIEPIYRTIVPPVNMDKPQSLYIGAIPAKKARRQLFTMFFPVPPATDSTEFTFFFDAFLEGVPICTTMEQLPYIVEPLLRFIGVQLYRKISTFIKLCRIGCHSRKDQDDSQKRCWDNLTRVHFLPVLSMAEDNPTLGHEIWPLIQNLEISARWSIYAEWLHQTYDSSPEMRLRKALITREVKGVLRRLSAKNLSQSARGLAKLTYHNPCLVFKIGIGQVMSYDNLADPLIEAMRTLNQFGYDILTFSLLDAFSDPDRPRMKDDGTNVSHWLQSLASFTAHLCRRYTAIDTASILQFVVHRLSGDSTPDAIILRELVAKMSGLDPLQMLSDDQVAAMGGGPILQTETVASEARGAMQTKSLQKPADRLILAMFNGDLMKPLLLLLAQQSQSCVYAKPKEAILKGLSSTFDDLRGIFFQFVSFLSYPSLPLQPTSSKLRADFFLSLPSLAELVEQYGVEPYMVFHMCRAPLQQAILDQTPAEPTPAAVGAPADKEETPAEAEARLRAQVAASRDNGMDDSTMNTGSPKKQPWLPTLQPWIDSASQILPARVLAVMGAPFFVTFWQLTLFEIISLVKQYRDQNTRLSKLIEDHSRTESSATSKSSRDRNAWVDRKERLDLFKEHLVKESKDHVKIYRATRKRLTSEKDSWFEDVDSNTLGELTAYIIQYCLFPRALLTPMDADYCAHFIKLLHGIGTKGFWTIRCYSSLLGLQLGSVLFSCTQNEARNYGRFLRGILRDLAAWFNDEAAYNADIKKGSSILPGFAATAAVYPPGAGDLYNWFDFKKAIKKMHTRLCSALAASLTNGEFMHVSNAILVLKEILPVFPLRAIQSGTGGFLDQALQDLLAKEKRGDIKLLATSYQGQLRMAKREWDVPTAKPGASTSSTKINGDNQPSTPRDDSGRVMATSSHTTIPSRPVASPAPPMTHPLPANPVRSKLTDVEMKGPERPAFVKRIDRTGDGPTPRESEELQVPDRSDKTLSPRPLPSDTADVAAANSPRPPTAQSAHGQREAPMGPRTAQRGHRISEDPSSRPPPSASMPPPRGPSSTPASQDIRASASQQRDRSRQVSEKDGVAESRGAGEQRRDDSVRSHDNGRSDSRRRSISPNRTSNDGPDGRRREDDRRSSKDDHRRTERRSGREDERDRDRERRGKDREGDTARHSTRPSLSRQDDPNRPDDSPLRGEDPLLGRKRNRDEEGSDSASKRPKRDRERDRDKEKDRDRRDRSGREHKHRERRRGDKDGGNSAGASPKEPDPRDRDSSRNGASATPSAPRAMMLPPPDGAKVLFAHASDAVRKDRDGSDPNSSSRPHNPLMTSSHPPRPSGSNQRRDARDERGPEDQISSGTNSLAARLGSGLPQRPTTDQFRDGDRGDRDGYKKRPASARSQDDIAGSNSGSKRPRYPDDRNRF